MSNVKEMTKVALKILEENPDYALCGSLGLILLNRIPEREINDLDFVYLENKDSFDVKNRADIFSEHSYDKQIRDGYTCYKTTRDVNNKYYNVFVHENYESIVDNLEVIILPSVNPIFVGHIIHIQSGEQMLQYKSDWNRIKDREDLGLEPLMLTGSDIPF